MATVVSSYFASHFFSFYQFPEYLHMYALWHQLIVDF